MKLFWGPLENDAHVFANTGTILTKDGAYWGAKQYTKHEITGVYGVQTRKGFIGFMRFGRWGIEHISRTEAGRAALRERE